MITDDCLRYKKLTEKSVLMGKEEEDQPNDVPLGKRICPCFIVLNNVSFMLSDL